MIYVTSDLHFGHARIIEKTGRPFASAEEMDQALIRNWNERISDTDEVYILGDFSMKGAGFVNWIFPQLNGRKYLVKGNHDYFLKQQSFYAEWLEWVKDYYELRVGDQWFVMFHYPIAEWNQYYQGAIHLHGHQHNHADYNESNRKNGVRRYDVGVDANGMRPVSIEEIMAFFET